MKAIKGGEVKEGKGMNYKVKLDQLENRPLSQPAKRGQTTEINCQISFSVQQRCRISSTVQ